ncbi:MAG: ribonuclease Z [Methanothrix sp.]|nr:ribonuclease Z [Methanothrix sp.]MDD4579751.1 ribonuclease Z [Methanothrix sp.]
MMLNVTFLGTAGSLPTPERNPSAVLVNREGELILFDCAEGTQRQMMRARTGMMRLNYIFLTHLHADHILGIPGLLETMAFQGRENPITIAGPVNTIRLVECFKSVCYFSRSFIVQAVELEPGDVIKMKGFQVRAISTNHSVPSIGYSLEEDMRLGRFNREAAISLGVTPGPLFGKLQHGQTIEVDGRKIEPHEVMGLPRPGRKVVYTGDTRPCKSVQIASQGADLLIHECALASDMAQWARDTKHSTAAEAAEVAKDAGVGQLVLTHISSRYSEDTSQLLKEAKSIFERTIVAEDLMSMDIRLKDE